MISSLKYSNKQNIEDLLFIADITTYKKNPKRLEDIKDFDAFSGYKIFTSTNKHDLRLSDCKEIINFNIIFLEDFVDKNNLYQFHGLINKWRKQPFEMMVILKYLGKITPKNFKIICEEYEIPDRKMPEDLVEKFCEKINDLYYYCNRML